MYYLFLDHKFEFEFELTIPEASVQVQ